MTDHAIIVAGGSGSRMGSELPKQFLQLGGIPILVRTVQTFLAIREEIKLILVLPQAHLEIWKEMADRFGIDSSKVSVMEGGQSRTASVRNGLNALECDHGLVAIHDGVRPLVTVDLILRCFKEAQKFGNAVAALPLKDSIRKLADNGSIAEDRSLFRLVQTPQVFSISELKEAYSSPLAKDATDDATLMEGYGKVIHLIDGEERNLKVTTPQDLLIAEAILAQDEHAGFGH